MRLKLSDIFDLQMGKTPSRNDPAFWNGNNIWVSIADIKPDTKYIYTSKEKITDSAIKQSGIKKVPKGTIIMSFKLSLGKTAITGNDLYTNEAIMAFHDKKTYDINPDFIYHLFNAMDWTAGTNKAVKGTTLNKATLSAKIIEVPSIEQQNKIASTMNSIAESIIILKQHLTKLDNLVKSRFIEMFGDPEQNPNGHMLERLGDILDVEPQNGFYKPQSFYVNDGSGTPILRVDAFYDGKVTDFKTLKRLICTNEELNLYLLKENDIIINRVNGSIERVGKCALITGLLEDTVYESNMMRLHPNENIVHPIFLTYMLCTDFIRKQIKACAKIANQCSVNQKDVQNLTILIPPMPLQQTFAAFVADIDKSKLVCSHMVLYIEILLRKERFS